MSGMELAVFVVFLATLIEWAVERFLGGIQQLKGWPMVWISAIVGVGLSFGFKVDIIQLVGYAGTYPWWLGQLVSGIIIGSGANAVHKFIKPSQK